MSRVYRSSDSSSFFQSSAEIEEHLLSKIGSCTSGKIGTELELFVTGPEGLPITFDQVEMLLEHMAGQFEGTKISREKDRIVGLHVPELGYICLEPGGQVEIAVEPCSSLKQLQYVNQVLKKALCNASEFLDLKVSGTGHMPSFLKAGDMPRSRFHAYYRYCRHEAGKAAEDLIKTMKSCCGLQINLDPMGEQFHEVYRALMLVEMGVVFSAQSTRRDRMKSTYASLFPEQTTPIFEALSARSNEEVIRSVVERLLTLKVPFVPDVSSEGFKSTLDIFGYSPTVGDLLKHGKLTVEILDNSLSLQLMSPNLRRHGVLETRAPDSVNTTEELMKVAELYYTYAYDAEARRKLLTEFRDISPRLVQERYTTGQGLDIGGGKTIDDLVNVVSKKTASPKHYNRLIFNNKNNKKC